MLSCVATLWPHPDWWWKEFISKTELKNFWLTFFTCSCFIPGFHSLNESLAFTLTELFKRIFYIKAYSFVQILPVPTLPSSNWVYNALLCYTKSFSTPTYCCNAKKYQKQVKSFNTHNQLICFFFFTVLIKHKSIKVKAKHLPFHMVTSQWPHQVSNINMIHIGYL